MASMRCHVASMAPTRPSESPCASRERSTPRATKTQNTHAGTSSASSTTPSTRTSAKAWRSRRWSTGSRRTPRCRRAASEREAARSQEDRNIGEITLPPHLREVKDRIADEVYKRTRATKTEEGNLRQDEYLIHGLQNWDVQNRSKGDGTLSPREIVDALGPKYLNLGVSDEEVRELIWISANNARSSSSSRSWRLATMPPTSTRSSTRRDRELVSLKQPSRRPGSGRRRMNS